MRWLFLILLCLLPTTASAHGGGPVLYLGYPGVNVLWPPAYATWRPYGYRMYLPSHLHAYHGRTHTRYHLYHR